MAWASLEYHFHISLLILEYLLQKFYVIINKLNLDLERCYESFIILISLKNY